MQKSEFRQSLLVTPIPIRVHAVWTALPRGVLGGAKTTSVYRNTKTNTWYPSALAKQLMGDNPSPGEADIYAEFNSSGVSWYLGTGQAPRGQYNLASVVLHELGHGLGITSSFDSAPPK